MDELPFTDAGKLLGCLLTTTLDHMAPTTRDLVSIEDAIKAIAPYSKAKAESLEKYVYQLVDRDELIDEHRGEKLPVTEPRITRDSITAYVQKRKNRTERRRADAESESTTPRPDEDTTPTALEARLCRIEELLTILVGTRENAAARLKAQVDEQKAKVQASINEATQARRQRDIVVNGLMQAWARNDELQEAHDAQSSNLKAFADVLTELLAPAVPPEP